MRAADRGRSDGLACFWPFIRGRIFSRGVVILAGVIFVQVTFVDTSYTLWKVTTSIRHFESQTPLLLGFLCWDYLSYVIEC